MDHIGFFRDFRDAAYREKTAVLGFFDGVHRGHLALTEAAKEQAAEYSCSPIAVSFSDPPHANTDTSGGYLLTDTEERCRLLAGAGLDGAVFLRFAEVRNLSPAEFISRILEEELRVKTVVCGYNFTFGKDRAGNAETLRAHFGDRATVCAPVCFGGEPVSSSRIRQKIAEGDVAGAADLLGRPFSLRQTTERGRQDGSAIGFPTANIFPDVRMAVPPAGVYITTVTLSSDGSVYPAVSDAGFAPTLDSTGKYRVESHLLDFSRCLYGEEITVRFLERIRPERAFSSAEELAAAIARDVQTARTYFSHRPI